MNRSFKSLVLILFLIPIGVMAQNDGADNGIPADTVNVEDQEEVILDEVFSIVEELPEYPGGMEALYRHVTENLSYPEKAKEDNIQGKVFVQFIIDKEGRVRNPKAVRGVDTLLDNEAVRIIKSLSNWTPGKQRGKPVNVRMVLPITFALN